MLGVGEALGAGGNSSRRGFPPVPWGGRKAAVAGWYRGAARRGCRVPLSNATESRQRVLAGRWPPVLLGGQHGVAPRRAPLVTHAQGSRSAPARFPVCLGRGGTRRGRGVQLTGASAVTAPTLFSMCVPGVCSISTSKRRWSFFFFFCACVHTPAGMKHPQGIPCLEFCSELLTYVNQILDAPPGCFLHLGCFCFSLPFLETVPLFDYISVALFCQLFKAFICRMSAKFRCCMQS